MPENKGSTASELDGLPDVDRKETEEILAEIEKDENKDLDKKPPEGENKKPPEDKKEEEKKPPLDEKKEDKKPPEDKGKKPEDSGREKKPPKLMPRYVHEIAVKEKEEKISELTKEIERLTKGKGPESKQEERTPEQQATLDKDIDELVKAHPSISKELAKSLVELGMKYGGKLPKDVAEKLQHVDKLREDSEIQAEETAFNTAFDKEVLPLIKSEYGELPADTISEIRETMKEKAYSDEFAKTPYSVIYKGVDDFRGFKRTPPKSGEESRGGHERTPEGSPSGDEEFENVSEEDIEKMDSATFDRYTAYVEKKERGK